MPQRFTTFIRASSLLALAALWILEGSTPTWAQQRQPHSLRAPAQALDAVATRVMPAVNNALLRARHPPPSGIGPLRFAEPLPVGITPTTDGTWETLDDGTHLWRLRVRSPDALSLNLGFTAYRMPPGGELFVYAPGYASPIGPFTASDNAAHGELWTPIVPGDEVVIEVAVPAEQRAALQLTLGQVGHGFRPLRRAAAQKSAGACNIDVACSQADPWRDQIQSVGRYTSSAGVLCTGTLVNTTAGNLTPYFLTANHCGVTPDNAASVVVYWNFENSFCRSPGADGGPGNGSLDEFSTGAIYRAGTGPAQPQYNLFIRGADFTLLELDTPVDVAFDPYFAGWSRTDDAPMEAVSLHHPQGEEMRISFDFDPSTVTSYLAADTTLAPTHLRVGDWDIGTTEVGSSGAPLFDADQRMVGILSGGFAGCSIDNPTVDNDLPDWYGRIAWAWDSGDSPSTRLRDWLDPLGTNALAINGMDVEEDTTPPGPITDFTVAEVSSNSITLTWQAPGDDGFQGTAAQYEVRYSTAPIQSLAAFDTARAVSPVPAPQASGSIERLTIDGLQANTPYYFAVLARDNVNNLSPLAVTETNAVILNQQVIIRPGYPNPFQTATTVGFAVDTGQRVRVDVYDAMGRQVKRVFDGPIAANTLREFQLNARGWTSGVYFVRFAGAQFERTTQVVHVQ